MSAETEHIDLIFPTLIELEPVPFANKMDSLPKGTKGKFTSVREISYPSGLPCLTYEVFSPHLPEPRFYVAYHAANAQSEYSQDTLVITYPITTLAYKERMHDHHNRWLDKKAREFIVWWNETQTSSYFKMEKTDMELNLVLEEPTGKHNILALDVWLDELLDHAPYAYATARKMGLI